MLTHLNSNPLINLHQAQRRLAHPILLKKQMARKKIE